jgi:peptide/nickel transport system ATP-binding protein
MIYQMADTALNPKPDRRHHRAAGEFYLGPQGRKLKQRVDELLDQIELEPSLYYTATRGAVGRAEAAHRHRPSAGRRTRPSSSATRSPRRSTSLVAEGILKLLDRLQKDLNLAYMFITHDLATVRSIADEVVVMKEGKVVEKGPKDEMFRRRITPIPTSAVLGPGDGPGLAERAAGRACKLGCYVGFADEV